jgi:hypothetical protein
MTIDELYIKANRSPEDFLNKTGMEPAFFNQLLGYFHLSIPNKCLIEKRLFAILYATKYNLNDQQIGKLLTYANASRDGLLFREKASAALKLARQAVTSALPLPRTVMPAVLPVEKKPERRQPPMSYEDNMTMALDCDELCGLLLIKPKAFNSECLTTLKNSSYIYTQSDFYYYNKASDTIAIILLNEKQAKQVSMLIDNCLNDSRLLFTRTTREMRVTVLPDKDLKKITLITGHRRSRSLSQTLSGELIIEHAQRRVDLFFYTLIAYYKTNLSVRIDTTILQHGAGNQCYQTEGCHSAILPSLQDIGYQKPSNLNTNPDQGRLLARVGLFSGRHFQQSLNATIELHQSVNYFDTHYIEGHTEQGKMRTQSLDILNQVSKGTLNPVQGMIVFLLALKKTIDEQEQTYLNKHELKKSPKETRPWILACIRKGSFHTTWHENKGYYPTLNDEYLDLILMLTRSELKEAVNALKQQADEPTDVFLNRLSDGKEALYERAYAHIKRDMGVDSQAESPRLFP